MRKMIILGLMAAAVMPSAVMAQSRGEVRDSARDLRQEQRELRDAQRYGDRRDVREQRRDVRDARQELREDWRDYRRSHRDVYRGGNWRAPFRYNRWEAGSQLRPSYYNSRYYITDYDRYRLQRPGRNLQWVRHYNDVLLVNVRTGRVVEVHRGFFW
ncbi:RcnB family protein [Sphingobium bisphenolivorans]|uniref:RcnB family protein n=1 Tax=Sphingobium bisphenolivorans TaxID=1335760 RepID=UPI00048A0462|nr:RcnB family protein [Sphingobium bisphenolivorans]